MRENNYSYGTILAGILALFMIGCSQHQTEKRDNISDVMDRAFDRIYTSLNEDELNKLDQDKALSFFHEKEIETLSKRHWVFHVDVPVVVSLMRSKNQTRLPFWLEPSGFKKSGMEVKNEYHAYEVWQKNFDAGDVELGINGFENFTYHYFVSVAPLNSHDKVEITPVVPEEQFMARLEKGAFTYHDWTELVLQDVPGPMIGQTLLTTIRGRGKESHLVGAFRKTKHPSSTMPDQVMLTWSSDPATTVDIQWRSSSSVNIGEVKYRASGSSVEQSLKADKFVMVDRELMNDRVIHRYTAKLTGLEPGTEYHYLVEPESDWGKARSFFTAANDDAFSFIWVGDVHQKKEFGELHKKAEATHPETAFYIIAGDLVDDGLYRDQWDELFYNSKEVIQTKPLMNVPGNHDNRYGLGAEMYREMFSYPVNGPEGVPAEQSYSFTYKNVLFLMLDATSPIERQSAWIEDQLAHTDATWKIAVFHFPPYNGVEPYLNIQEGWVPFFDKYQVDMVFSGYFHYYMPSGPMKNGEVSTSDERTIQIILLGIPG